MSSLSRLVAVVGLVLASGLSAESSRGDEVDDLLAFQLQQIRDQARPVLARMRIASEAALALDRAAREESKPDRRRGRWSQAADVLDEFNTLHSRHPEARQFALQAEIYRWAEARSWLDQADLNPPDRTARERAKALLDASIARLSALNESLSPDAGPTSASLLAQNVRFRLAEELADRARVEPKPDEQCRSLRARALKVLEVPITEPSLIGPVDLLRAELLGTQARTDDALKTLRRASKVKPAPSPNDLLRVRVGILLDGGRPAEALKVLGPADGSDPTRGWLRARALLAAWSSETERAGRPAHEAELFDLLGRLREGGSLEGRLAVLAAARTIETPGPDRTSDAWDILADGRVRLGDLVGAGDLTVRAAEIAAASGQAEKARNALYRAGALRFRIGRYAEADTLLSRVYEDQGAGALRPKAGMLRALARGRALAEGPAGTSPRPYEQALADLLRDFPDDPTAIEARWLLGHLKLRPPEPDEDAAIALWTSIPHGAPRWVDARAQIARVQLDAVDRQKLNGDRTALSRQIGRARAFLAASIGEANDSERLDLELLLARLDLHPGVGRPDSARASCERVLNSVSRAEQREKARRLRLAALVQLNRFTEADTLARAEADSAPLPDLLDLVRLIDRSTTAEEAERHDRRVAQVLEVLLKGLTDRLDQLTPAQKAEVRIRQAHALILAGNYAAANTRLDAETFPLDVLSDDLLSELAEAHRRVDEPRSAAGIERQRARRLKIGSLPWLDARYGLALSLYLEGRHDEARQLIDATSVLHPELGGGTLRTRFEQLRQRLGS